MNKPINYKDQFKQFEINVNFAARTWHRQIQLDKEASEDDKLREALNKAAHFWDDQRFSVGLITIITLGNIFDLNGDSSSIYKLLKAAQSDQQHFGKGELRKRKVARGCEFPELDDYVKNAFELDNVALKSISNEIKKAKKIWSRIEPLRNKIYAHNGLLSEEQRSELYSAVNISDINNILQILLNTSNALWQAEQNGHKPNFASDHTQPINWAKKDIEELKSSLLYSPSI